MEDGNVTVRVAAISALTGNRSKSKLIAVKLSDALTDKEPVVKRAAIDALQEYVPLVQPTVERLIELLSSPDRDVRLSAIRLLGASGPEAAKGLPQITKLLNEQDASLCRTAARAIASIDRRTVEPLIEQLKSVPEKRELVRELAVAGLTAMRVGLRYKEGQITHISFYRRPKAYEKSKPSNVTNEDLKLLRHLPDIEEFFNVHSLSLAGTQVDNDGLVYLSG
ncbi:MAG: hypothetical protein CMJ78_26135 [Planctomycetaceae bacterium]|nr:hypothetical protein [Planctomycetaceae bacterium]